MATPQRDPRTGIFYLRRGIPVELRPFFNGKHEHKVSLKTRDPAEAKARFAEPNAAFEQQLDAARRQAKYGWSAEAQELLERWLKETGRDRHWLIFVGSLLSVYSYSMGSQPVRSWNAPRAIFVVDKNEPREALALRVRLRRYRMYVPNQIWFKHLLPLDERAVRWVIDEITQHTQTKAEVGTPLHAAIGRAFLGRIIQILSEIETRTKHSEPTREHVVSSADAIEAAPMRIPGTTPPPSFTLRDAFEAWKTPENGRKTPGSQLVDDWGLAVDRFVALHGNTDVRAITQAMIEDYQIMLQGLPSRAKKAVSKLPLLEQVQLAKEQQMDTLAAGTINKAVSGIRRIIAYVIKSKALRWVGLTQNVAIGLDPVEDDTEFKDSRLPFEEDELAKIFSNPVIVDSTGISAATFFWLILLAAFTGTRLEELGKLRPRNIRGERGIWYIAFERDRKKIRKENEGPEKSGKNNNSLREIAIHSIVERAGFIEYVQMRRTEGSEWLFPDLTQNKYGKRTQRVSRLFGDYLDSLGITDNEKVYHSFRHSVRRNLRREGPNEEIVDYMLGHSDGRVSRLYGRGVDIRELKRTVEYIDLSGPDWDAVVIQGRTFLNEQSVEATAIPSTGRPIAYLDDILNYSDVSYMAFRPGDAAGGVSQ